ncbi:hypothetical protein M885DRAFT_549041 [Pelagophyceae sp. CCMP2097]|nr:hypothetical protein M885DRAFT_549041 [Pelagophyceae sp. CCMP2097]
MNNMELPGWVGEAVAKAKAGASLAGTTCFDGIRTAVVTVRKLEEDGTPIRDAVKVVRLGTNAALGRASEAFEGVSVQRATAMNGVTEKTAFIKPYFESANNVRKNQPELIVLGCTLPLIFLSLPFGRKRVVLNTLYAGGASSAAVYGARWWETRFNK